MTIPWMMNCGHSETGWCLECVMEQGEDWQRLRHDNARLSAANAGLENDLEKDKAEIARLAESLITMATELTEANKKLARSKIVDEVIMRSNDKEAAYLMRRAREAEAALRASEERERGLRELLRDWLTACEHDSGYRQVFRLTHSVLHPSPASAQEQDRWQTHRQEWIGTTLVKHTIDGVPQPIRIDETPSIPEQYRNLVVSYERPASLTQDNEATGEAGK